MTEPTKNVTFATPRITFRPQMSLSLPHRGVAAASARRYAAGTQTKADEALK